MVVSNWRLSGSTSRVRMSVRTKTTKEENKPKAEPRHFACLHVYIKYKQFTLNAKVPPPGIEPRSSADILTSILQRNCIIAILGGYNNHYSTAELYFCEFGVV